MDSVTEEEIFAIGGVLNDANRPLKERFRAMFTLEDLGGPVSINCMKRCFDDPSALLKHDLAYCLGQMGDKAAIPVLKSVLKDKSQEIMVRHESAEALAAIGCEESLDILQEHLKDPVPEVSETCELAIERIRWLNNEGRGTETKSPYASVDPAPPARETDVLLLEKVLLDQSKPMFQRYRAMFALRNLQTSESVSALSKGLFLKDSALFRHEIAFVLGQMQNESSVSSLRTILEDLSENEMVRHECAEALAAIATDDCRSILKNFLEDEKCVVKESCEVALDMYDYEYTPQFPSCQQFISSILNSSRPVFFIKHLLSMPQHRIFKHLFMYRGKEIRQVCCMGTIVDIKRTTLLIRCAVDDGSGVISCVLYKKSPIFAYEGRVKAVYDHYKVPENNENQNSRSKVMQKLQPVVDLYKRMYSLSLGQCVLVPGRLVTYNDRPQDADKRFVIAKVICPVEDIQVEIDFIKRRSQELINSRAEAQEAQ